MLEQILKLAAAKTESAEVFKATSEELPVHFEANKLKSIQGKQSISYGLRIIKDGRLGFASASGNIRAEDLVAMAIETAAFGQVAKFDFPSATHFPETAIVDDAIDKVKLETMIATGQDMIEAVLTENAEVLCD